MEFYLRIVAGTLFLALGTWLAILNAGVFWKVHVRKQEAPSWIPLLGGLFGVVGLLLLPFEATRDWWWIPLLLDWGCAPGIGHTILFHLCGRKQEPPIIH
jgi:hypothetical protein